MGLFARKVMDHHLYFLPFARLASTGRVDGWAPVFESPLGNVLLLERRVIADRLVCPASAAWSKSTSRRSRPSTETARATTNGSMAVVGRIDGGSFAVTSGTPQPWGLDALRPALLVGSPGESLADLGRALATETLPVAGEAPRRRRTPRTPPRGGYSCGFGAAVRMAQRCGMSSVRPTFQDYPKFLGAGLGVLRRLGGSPADGLAAEELDVEVGVDVAAGDDAGDAQAGEELRRLQHGRDGERAGGLDFEVYRREE